MTIEGEIASSLAEQIAKEIDKEILDTIMIDVLTKDGWTVTTINPKYSTDNILFPKPDWYSETAEWIHLNATGDYKLLKGQWVFEQQADAVMFTLKWS